MSISVQYWKGSRLSQESKDHKGQHSLMFSNIKYKQVTMNALTAYIPIIDLPAAESLSESTSWNKLNISLSLLLETSEANASFSNHVTLLIS